jgi:hypothetical protein
MCPAKQDELFVGRPSGDRNADDDEWLKTTIDANLLDGGEEAENVHRLFGVSPSDLGEDMRPVFNYIWAHIGQQNQEVNNTHNI